MPTYYRPGTRKGNRTWSVRGYIDGRQYEIATDADNKADAQTYWHDFRRATLGRNRAVVTAETARFADAVTLYRAQRALSKNDRTFVDRLEARLGAVLLADVTPGLVTGAALEIYPDARPQTVNRQGIRPAAAIMHLAHDHGLVPWMRFKTLPETDPERPIATPAETIRLARKARGELRVLLITLAHQGWRITETLAIERAWHDPEESRVRRFVSKSRKWRWTALAPSVNAFWQRLPERADGRLFPWPDRHAVYRETARLDPAWRPHQARRGFATALLENGADLKSIAAAGNWEDVKSVLVYADADLEQSRRTLRRIRGKTRGTGTKG